VTINRWVDSMVVRMQQVLEGEGKWTGLEILRFSNKTGLWQSTSRYGVSLFCQPLATVHEGNLVLVCGPLLLGQRKLISDWR